MKRFLLLFVFCSVCLLNAQVVWNGSTKMWSRGSGSESDPFLIENGENLAYLAQSVYSGNRYENVYFLLTVNLDLGGAPSQSPRQSWMPIGMSSEKTFNGNFDGGGKTIANLYVNTSNEYAGLFGYTGGGSIKNLGIIGNSSVISSSSSADIGGIVGYSKSLIVNCFNMGLVTGSGENSTSGGIAGYSQMSIMGCYNTASISSMKGNAGSSGGIVGRSLGEINIFDCYNTGAISGRREVGGIAGDFWGTMERCYNTGSVSANASPTSNAGGLIGSCIEISISESYNMGSVSAQAMFYGSVSHAVPTESFAGGLVGGGYPSSVINLKNCYSVGDVSSDSYTSFGISTSYGGKIVSGKSSLRVNNCYCRTESELNLSGTEKFINTAGDSKTEAELKAGSFVSWLNNGLEPQIWFADNRVDVNDGYPILVSQKIFDIDVSSDGNGSVTGGGEYRYNSIAELVASADENYHFAGWSDGSNDNPRKITVKSDGVYVAKFSINRFSVAVSGENGNISGGGEYDYGTDVWLTAVADYGYHFSGWDDGNVENPRLISVVSDSLFTANFSLNSYMITVNAGENGSVSEGGVFKYNTEIELTATADEHYHFVKWDDGNVENPRKVKVTMDATYTAEFAINLYTVTIIPSANGSVTGGGEYIYGDEVLLTAIADNGFSFVKWSDGSVENPRKVVVENNLAFQAEFVINKYVVTVVAGANGSVTGGGEFTFGSSIIITAIADEGYRFVKWSDGNTDNPRTLVVSSVLTILAEFEKLPVIMFTVDILTPQNGSIVVKKGGEVVESGNSVLNGSLLTISLIPNEGYVVDKIFVNGVEVISTVVKVESDVIIEVFFKLSDGVEDLMENDVRIFSFDKTITVDAKDLTVDITVINMNGSVVACLNSVEGKNEIKIEQSGVYVVKVGNISKKVVLN